MNKLAVKAILILAAGLALGLLAAVQLKNVNLAGGDVSLDRTRELMSEMDMLRADKATLIGKLAAMDDKAATMKADVEKANTELDKLKATIENTRRSAGLTEVAGFGLVVIINPRTYMENGKKKIVKQITDQELLSLANELYSAGAEAISINGHRLIATSAIRLAGDFININRIPTSMPYEVIALGSAKNLDAALRLYGGVLDKFNEFYDVSITSSDNIKVPAYEGEIVFHYARQGQ